MLIYQGLTNGDIKNLELKDIDLEQGTVYIKSGRKTNRRTLKLRSNQVFWLMNYLQNDTQVKYNLLNIWPKILKA